ncbi:hypothetical protein SRHO_G00187760 [Serrasalmus rhombeus]
MECWTGGVVSGIGFQPRKSKLQYGAKGQEVAVSIAVKGARLTKAPQTPALSEAHPAASTLLQYEDAALRSGDPFQIHFPVPFLPSQRPSSALLLPCP